ncbi:adhesin, partial [Burkholderia multivorans]
TVLGAGAHVGRTGGVAVGVAATATGTDGLATGARAQAAGFRSTAIGADATAAGDRSTSVGNGASATAAHSIALGSDAVASGTNSVALGHASVADRDDTVSVGAAGRERKIAHVADGVLPSDAVNMRQLHSVARRAYGGVAAATALSMIPDVDAGKTIAVGIGTGGYLGYQAVALGASVRFGENLKLRAGASLNAATTTWGAGASYSW